MRAWLATGSLLFLRSRSESRKRPRDRGHKSAPTNDELCAHRLTAREYARDRQSAGHSLLIQLLLRVPARSCGDCVKHRASTERYTLSRPDARPLIADGSVG